MEEKMIKRIISILIVIAFIIVLYNDGIPGIGKQWIFWLVFAIWLATLLFSLICSCFMGFLSHVVGENLQISFVYCTVMSIWGIYLLYSVIFGNICRTIHNDISVLGWITLVLIGIISAIHFILLFIGNENQ